MSKAQRCYFLIDYLQQYFPGPCLNFQEWGGLSLGLLNVLDLWFSWIIDKVLYRWEKK